MNIYLFIYLQVTDREMQNFSQSQLMDQGSMHNSGIDIPKRKDKEDLTESSEVCQIKCALTHKRKNTTQIHTNNKWTQELHSDFCLQ